MAPVAPLKIVTLTWFHCDSAVQVRSIPGESQRVVIADDIFVRLGPTSLCEIDTIEHEVIKMSSVPTESDDWEPFQPAHDEAFVANITERADDVEKCSISPLPRGEQMLETEWIAATDGSFVPLDDMR